ncbi:MAG: hypothetical protein HF314_03335 [Ignavibacteria bacterium]|jgi:hypothetical protein|nr:hypothetical protein [Ignavibacteria bacterium]MCU7502083.1 hypothetical protein [Ignavibacteria bacterium]MCU7515485.1 hypothetical protein [Ignavibacteria bacterium]
MKNFAILVLLMTFLAGCGYNESITIKADKSYLKFVGNTEMIQISIDGGDPFPIDNKIDLYQTAPGKHEIKITRNSQVVVKRLVFLDNKTTMEIKVP